MSQSSNKKPLIACCAIFALLLICSGIGGAGWLFFGSSSGDVMLEDMPMNEIEPVPPVGKDSTKSKTKTAKTSKSKKSSSGNVCDEYVKCLCAFSSEMGAKSPAASASFEQMCKTSTEAFKGSTSSVQKKTCKMSFDSFKNTLQQSKAAYKSMGVSIPESCQ